MKKSVSQLLTATVAAIAITTLAACASPTIKKDADWDEPGRQAGKPLSSQTAEPTPEPAPVPEAGTLANPFPTGSPLIATDSGGNELYNVTAALTNGDATAAIIEENQFNDLPAAGFKYITVNVTYTAINATKPTSPSMESYDLRVAGADGTLYTQASVVSPGTAMYEGGDLYAGQTFTGEIVFTVPTDQSVFYLTSLGVYVGL